MVVIETHNSITTNFKQYGSNRTVEPFDLPVQNTINNCIVSVICNYVLLKALPPVCMKYTT